MPKALQELISTMRFPVGGIDLMHLPSGQRPGTTAVGNNVRGFEPMTGRARGGSRPGIERYINEQVNGSDYIQHLNYIVIASGNAVGASFGGIDLGDIGALGVDNFGGLTPSPYAGWGGGGYQPAKPRLQSRVTLAIVAVSAGSFTPTVASVPKGSNVTLVATVRDFAGNAQAFENVRLNTSPTGRPGDNTTETTVFALDDPPLGTVTYLVTDPLAENVVYSVQDTSNNIPGANKVTVHYLQTAPSPPTTGGDDGHGHCRGLSVSVILEKQKIDDILGIVEDVTSTLATWSAVPPYNVGTAPSIASNNGIVPAYGSGPGLPATTWRATATGTSLSVSAFNQAALVFDMSQALASPPACALNILGFDTGLDFIRSARYSDMSGSGIVKQFLSFVGTASF